MELLLRGHHYGSLRHKNNNVMKNFLKTSEKGVGLVEILIAVAIIATSFFAITQISITAMSTAQDRTDKVKALEFAQEGIEAVRSLRDGSFTNNIGVLTFGSTYYGVISGGKWTLTLSNPGLLASKFTRTIVVSNVSRDINDNIVTAGGTNDTKTKKVTATVSWGSPVKSVQLSAYIADILKN